VFVLGGRVDFSEKVCLTSNSKLGPNHLARFHVQQLFLCVETAFDPIHNFGADRGLSENKQFTLLLIVCLRYNYYELSTKDGIF
jgi:hypothetical protein